MSALTDPKYRITVTCPECGHQTIMESDDYMVMIQANNEWLTHWLNSHRSGINDDTPPDTSPSGGNGDTPDV